MASISSPPWNHSFRCSAVGATSESSSPKCPNQTSRTSRNSEGVSRASRPVEFAAASWDEPNWRRPGTAASAGRDELELRLELPVCESGCCMVARAREADRRLHTTSLGMERDEGRDQCRG